MTDKKPTTEYVGFIGEIPEHMKLSSRYTAEARKVLELSLLGCVPGDHSDERRYHEMFADDRVRGEWFRPSVKLTHFIKEVTA